MSNVSSIAKAERDEAVAALDARVLDAMREGGAPAAVSILVEALDDQLVGAAAARRLARLHLRSGEEEPALRALRDARRRFPGDLDLKVDEAAVLSVSDPPAAAVGLEEVLVEDPERADAIAMLAELRREASPEEALALAVRALECDPGLARAHIVRIELLAQRAQDGAVAAATDEAVRSAPGHGGLRLVRALWRMSQGDEEGALADLQAVQVLSPGHPGLRPAVQELVRRRSVLYRTWSKAVDALSRGGPRLRLAIVLLIGFLGWLVASLSLQGGESQALAGAGLMGSFLLLAQLWVIVPAVSDVLLDQDPLGAQVVEPRKVRRGLVVVAFWLSGAASTLTGLAMARPLAAVWGTTIAMLAPVLMVMFDARGQARRAAARAVVACTSGGLAASFWQASQGGADAAGIGLFTMAMLAMAGALLRVGRLDR